MKLLRAAIFITMVIFARTPSANGAMAAKSYVDNIISANNFETKNNKTTSINSASTDNQYPSARAAYTYGANADNLTNGTVAYGRLPVGTTANTVTAGDDSRHWAVPTGQHTGTPPSGWAWVWIEP